MRSARQFLKNTAKLIDKMRRRVLLIRVWRAGEGRRYELHGAHVVPMGAADLYDPFEAAEVIAGRAATSPAEAQPESIGGAGGRLPYVPTGCFGAEWAVEDRGYYLADRLERLTAARGAAVRR